MNNYRQLTESEILARDENGKIIATIYPASVIVGEMVSLEYIEEKENMDYIHSEISRLQTIIGRKFGTGDFVFVKCPNGQNATVYWLNSAAGGCTRYISFTTFSNTDFK